MYCPARARLEIRPGDGGVFHGRDEHRGFLFFTVEVEELFLFLQSGGNKKLPTLPVFPFEGELRSMTVRAVVPLQWKPAVAMARVPPSYFWDINRLPIL